MSSNKMADKDYLHGFTSIEQERLKKQAIFAEQTIYRNIDFSGVQKLLEVGSGVGAQTEILLRRFPGLKVTGIDQNEKQLATARDYLNKLAYAKGRFQLHQMDATNLDFESGSFDAAFLCWVLEHIPNPSQVLSEVRRVVRKGGMVIITEVMNHSFFLDPYSPNVWKYWMAMNDYQYEQAGDPFIGAKLGNLLLALGYTNIQSTVHTWHFDNRDPSKRKMYIDFWTELLLSAKDQLLNAQCIDEKTVEEMQRELAKVAKDPNAVFYYSFMQMTAQTI